MCIRDSLNAAKVGLAYEAISQTWLHRFWKVLFSHVLFIIWTSLLPIVTTHNMVGICSGHDPTFSRSSLLLYWYRCLGAGTRPDHPHGLGTITRKEKYPLRTIYASVISPPDILRAGPFYAGTPYMKIKTSADLTQHRKVVLRWFLHQCVSAIAIKT